MNDVNLNITGNESESDLKSKVLDFLSEFYNNKAVLYSRMFPESFFRPFTTLHNLIINALVETGYRFKLVLAPRGSGKTEIIKAFVIDKILFKQKFFIVYISKSATSAEMQTENIKQTLTSNKFIQAVWGDIKEPFFKAGRVVCILVYFLSSFFC